MRKAFSIVLLILSVCILLCISCNDSKTTQIGILEIRIGNQDGFKGIAPVSMDISGYSVSVMDSDDNVVFSKSITPRDENGSCKVSLATGEYTVRAVATNSEGKTIGEGSATVLIEPGKTNSCSVFIHEIEGEGTVCFSYYGEESDELTVEIQDASMIPVATLPLVLEGRLYTGSLDLDNGFYLLTIRKADGSVIMTDTIRVLSNTSIMVSDGIEKMLNDSDSFHQFEIPFLLTSGGQGAGSKMLRLLVNQTKKYTLAETEGDFWLEDETPERYAYIDSGNFKTLVIVISSTEKGLGASGITIEDEIGYLGVVLEKAKAKGMKIIAISMEADARSQDSTNGNERIIDLVCPQADYIISLAANNNDGRFTQFSQNYGIPLTIIQKPMDLVRNMEQIFPKE